MALRRALVVDDSKLARIALKKQLEAYDLAVELADSGEEALEFLKYETVDVIFMDHIMPGMSGLEAVKALKSNPRTATIPVMMYTSKEGELYVSQARALGAVDVLPKDVHPGLLFEMLMKLGLVRDRRRDRDETAGEDVSQHDLPDLGETDQYPGMPMPQVLSRIIEDQYSAFRSEILSNQLAFAKHVAHEVYEMQKADTDTEPDPFMTSSVDSGRGSGMAVFSAVCATAAVFFAVLFLNARGDRDDAQQRIESLSASVEDERRTSASAAELLSSDADAQRLQAGQVRQQLYDTLTWAMNEMGAVEFGDVPFNALRAEQVGGLLARLRDTGFAGTVRLESHLGEFCLVADQTGNYALADAGAPVGACTVIGHPLDDSLLLGERMTPAFQEFLDASPLLEGTGIELDIVVHDRVFSVPRIPYPAAPLSAGHWNEVARRNNRVEFTLLPATNANDDALAGT